MKIAKFDVIAYLDTHERPHREAAGAVFTMCPSCRDNDFNFKIEPKSKIFKCCRCHISGNLVNLVSLLEDIPAPDAFSLLNGFLYGMEGYELTYRRIIFNRKLLSYTPIITEVLLPEHSTPLKPIKQKIYNRFLTKGAKFNPAVYLTWDCYYCTKGEWEGYLIFPVKLGGKMVCYTGRAIYDNRAEYVRNCPANQALLPIQDTVYNYDSYNRGDEIIIVEDIFDALRLESFGYKAICLFGHIPSIDQIRLLLNKCPSKITVLCGEKGNLLPDLYKDDLSHICPTRVLKYRFFNHVEDILDSRLMALLLHGARNYANKQGIPSSSVNMLPTIDTM